MFNNYFYLFRSVLELNELLLDVDILDIYSQEKDRLYLHVPSQNHSYRHLIISANAQSPFLLIKREHKKAKKNTLNFFNEFIPDKIQKIEIASNDRVIRIKLLNSEILFYIMGRNTNIVLIDKNSNAHYFKKSNYNILSKENSFTFISDVSDLTVLKDTGDYTSLKALKSNYPMISSEIKGEILYRTADNHAPNYTKVLSDIVQEIYRNQINIGLSPDTGKVVFSPETFNSIKNLESPQKFHDFNSSLQHHISTTYKQSNRRNISKELEKYFEQEMTRLSSKLNKLKSRIDAGSKESTYYENANLLLSNINELKKGMAKIPLKSLTEDKTITITIDPKLSPKNNIDKYFEKARDEKLNFNKSIELFKFTKEKYEEMRSLYKRFTDSNSYDELSNIYGKIFTKKEKNIRMDSGLKFKYWHYLIDDSYNVYVGRDSKSNDYLSVKFAKQNDYWFHARGLPGSHVVLRVDNVKEGIPKNIIKNAASLAAYHSKAKTAGTAPVSYTIAKYVYKKKGMPPGKVLLTKEKTLLVKPEIPKNTELVNE